MHKLIPITLISAVLVIAGWLAWGSVNPGARPALGGATSSVATATEREPLSYECNADAKICSDGSSVGRTGPSCEFTACPPPESKNGVIRTTIGQRMTAIHVTITPRKIVDDSRCPSDVQCIWAGTAHVKTTVTTPAGSSDVVFELAHPEIVGDYRITLSELTPASHSGEVIQDSSYRFVFTVEKV